MRLRIVHKGLIYLCLPLAAQGIFFFQLFKLIEQTERSIVNQTRHINMSREMNFVIIQFCRTLANVSKGSSGIMPLTQYKTLMDTHLAALEAYLKDTSEDYQQVFSSSKHLVSAQYKLLALLQNQDDDLPMNSLQRLMLTKEVIANAESAGPIVYNAWNNEERLLEEERLKEQESREKIKRLIVGASIFDFSLALVLITFFIKNITQRVDLLVKNARVLPTSSELPYKIGGTDEIAFLDSAMREASGELIKAAAHRKSLLQMLAHDLKNPLTAIGLSFEAMLLNAESGLITIAEKRIRTLHQSLTQITTLLEDMLALDKMEGTDLTLDVSFVSAADLVNDACNLVTTQAERKSIVLTSDVETVSIIGDRNRLVQVLSNFIGNAIRYSPSETTVLISVKKEKKTVRFAVSDQGPGIASHLHESVFEKFFRVEQNLKAGGSSGYGLGLAICKQIVNKHNGAIGVESVPGNGATFWFSLPLDEEEIESESC
ncbi:MAG: HAMP domain-containing sensor histidine kinase [Candidatus Obscuribacterales bacterium]|nr:HAMP domain-containing sensor histidine kinase [Candidatus Obscuribacterales bacterium]